MGTGRSLSFSVFCMTAAGLGTYSSSGRSGRMAARSSTLPEPSARSRRGPWLATDAAGKLASASTAKEGGYKSTAGERGGGGGGVC